METLRISLTGDFDLSGLENASAEALERVVDAFLDSGLSCVGDALLDLAPFEDRMASGAGEDGSVGPAPNGNIPRLDILAAALRAAGCRVDLRLSAHALSPDGCDRHDSEPNRSGDKTGGGAPDAASGDGEA